MQEINSPSLWLDEFTTLKEDINKYDRGHSIILGSDFLTGSTGATKLAALSTLRAGAGLVSIISDKRNAPIYAASMFSVMVKIIKNRSEFIQLIQDTRIKSILIGPGNGITIKTKNNVLDSLEYKKNLVIDADAITVFKNNPGKLFSNINSDVVLTPHEGEFRRIFKLEEDKISSVIKSAKISNCTVILKGHDSIIASPQGNCVINKSAPSSLATAGSGDVLAGMIAGFMAQGVSGFKSCCIASFIHAKCAELFGKNGLISEDIINQIPHAIDVIKNS